MLNNSSPIVDYAKVITFQFVMISASMDVYVCKLETDLTEWLHSPVIGGFVGGV